MPSSTDVALPIIDMDVFRAGKDTEAGREQALQSALALITYGALIVKDSRVQESDNDDFLDLMEDYFAQPREELQKDTRPELYFQVGTTLEDTERPKCHADFDCKNVVAQLDPTERPIDAELGKADPKCRFFRHLGNIPPPLETSFPRLQSQNITPAPFSSTWDFSMDRWGNQMWTCVEDLTRMVGQGLEEICGGKGVEQEMISASKYGVHLLAPTATDLIKYNALNTVMAGFHTDLNFLTIHGRSRYPGLHIWARNTGKRLNVKLPKGCLLVQAGKQLEHLTAGLILAGYHEVVITPSTLAVLESRRLDPQTKNRPFIRISSTFFFHLTPEYEMRPKEFGELVWGKKVGEKGENDRSEEIGKYKLDERVVEQVRENLVENKYKPMKVGDHTLGELKAIDLARS